MVKVMTIRTKAETLEMKKTGDLRRLREEEWASQEIIQRGDPQSLPSHIAEMTCESYLWKGIKAGQLKKLNIFTNNKAATQETKLVV